MKINLTINNITRHPLHWGKGFLSTKKYWVFGAIYETHLNPELFGKIHLFAFYFYNWSWQIRFNTK